MLFYDDNYLTSCDTVVTGTKNINDITYVSLKDTIFYAQGGGQKSDRGTLLSEGNTFRLIRSVKGENGEVLLQVECDDPVSLVNKDVHCELDWSFRYKQMKLHTALHILHCVMEEQKGETLVYPMLSTIEEDSAVNKYKNAAVSGIDFAAVEQRMNELFSTDTQVITYADSENPLYRYWKCMDWMIPCGGIHVHSLKEIGRIHLHTHTKKGNMSIQVFLDEQ